MYLRRTNISYIIHNLVKIWPAIIPFVVVWKRTLKKELGLSREEDKDIVEDKDN